MQSTRRPMTEEKRCHQMHIGTDCVSGSHGAHEQSNAHVSDVVQMVSESISAGGAGGEQPPVEPINEEVLEVLSSLILFKNRADAGGWRDAFENMPVYMERVGLTSAEIGKLKVVHVAGTKGKGSTCAMVERILRQCGYRTGLYTSPHLIDVRERVRINGQMVSKQVFESHFWDCYNQFRAAATDSVGVPGYFRFITLLAMKIFLSQDVDVVVLEVGIGGRLDATNIIPQPVVCGITSLGFDHMDMLGDTLPKIAREKAGILKAGRPGFTTPQPDDALQALQESAAQTGAPLSVVDPLDSWTPADGRGQVEVALGGEHQRINASLAVQLCSTFEAHCVAHNQGSEGAAARVALLQQHVLPPQYLQGLAATSWAGRSQVVHDQELEPTHPNGDVQPQQQQQVAGNSQSAIRQGSSSRLSFFIDGAHTAESMISCAEWFATAANNQPPPRGVSDVQRVLLFNCMKERDPTSLLPTLAASLKARGVNVSHALFVPPESQYGFLPTKKTPHPPSTPNLTNPSHVTAPPAFGQQNGMTAPNHVSKNGSSALGAATTGVSDAVGVRQTDLSWQVQLQQVWEGQCGSNQHSLHTASSATINGAAMPPLPALPALQGLPVQDSSRGAVTPSLRSAIEWLRSVAQQRPQLQLQVLVTGSLYLVGDVLRLLKRVP